MSKPAYLIVIPAHNEGHILRKSVLQLKQVLQMHQLWEKTQVLVVNNASTDHSLAVLNVLKKEIARFDFLNVDVAGKGYAIKKGFEHVNADIYCFMDADLATDIHLLPMLLQCVEKEADICIGSRFLKHSLVYRSWKRRYISFLYSFILSTYFSCPVTDFPCGFKAFKKRVIEDVLPKVQNPQWFFDPELIILAHKMGFTMKEIPIIWHEEGIDSGRLSKLHIVRDAKKCLKEMVRLKKRLCS